MASREEYESNLQKSQYVDQGQSMRLPIKGHILKLEDMLQGLLDQLEDSRKEIQMLRSEFIAMEHSHKENCNNMSKEIMDEACRLEKDYHKIQQLDKSEIHYLRQQIYGLNQDKIKLQQNTLVLENKIANVESDVGFKFYYEHHMDMQ